MNHVILLGDSIFDNQAYVPGGPSVIEHLRRVLPSAWKATLLARDGAIAEDVNKQLDQLPADCTRLVVRAGGNNALSSSFIFSESTPVTFLEGVNQLGKILNEFQREYSAMLANIVSKGMPVVACTIYDSIPTLGDAERTGLRLFNEVILREAFKHRVALIDLRLICNVMTDYASTSPIEPSASGGGKIARAIARAVVDAEPSYQGTRIFV